MILTNDQIPRIEKVTVRGLLFFRSEKVTVRGLLGFPKTPNKKKKFLRFRASIIIKNKSPKLKKL